MKEIARKEDTENLSKEDSQFLRTIEEEYQRIVAENERLIKENKILEEIKGYYKLGQNIVSFWKRVCNRESGSPITIDLKIHYTRFINVIKKLSISANFPSLEEVIKLPSSMQPFITKIVVGSERNLSIAFRLGFEAAKLNVNLEILCHPSLTPEYKVLVLKNIEEIFSKLTGLVDELNEQDMLSETAVDELSLHLLSAKNNLESKEITKVQESLNSFKIEFSKNLLVAKVNISQSSTQPLQELLERSSLPKEKQNAGDSNLPPKQSVFKSEQQGLEEATEWSNKRVTGYDQGKVGEAKPITYLLSQLDKSLTEIANPLLVAHLPPKQVRSELITALDIDVTHSWRKYIEPYISFLKKSPQAFYTQDKGLEIYHSIELADLLLELFKKPPSSLSYSECKLLWRMGQCYQEYMVQEGNEYCLDENIACWIESENEEKLWSYARCWHPFVAVCEGHAEILKKLLDHFPDDFSINQPDKEGWTLLHWAVHKKNEEIIDLLLNSGAEIYANANGKYPFGLPPLTENEKISLPKQNTLSTIFLPICSGLVWQKQADLRQLMRIEKVDDILFYKIDKAPKLVRCNLASLYVYIKTKDTQNLVRTSRIERLKKSLSVYFNTELLIVDKEDPDYLSEQTLPLEEILIQGEKQIKLMLEVKTIIEQHRIKSLVELSEATLEMLPKIQKIGWMKLGKLYPIVMGEQSLEGDQDCAFYLLEREEKIIIKQAEKWNLHFACHFYEPTSVIIITEILEVIQKKEIDIDINMLDSYNQTPLDKALRSNDGYDNRKGVCIRRNAKTCRLLLLNKARSSDWLPVLTHSTLAISNESKAAASSYSLRGQEQSILSSSTSSIKKIKKKRKSALNTSDERNVMQDIVRFWKRILNRESGSSITLDEQVHHNKIRETAEKFNIPTAFPSLEEVIKSPSSMQPFITAIGVGSKQNNSISFRLGFEAGNLAVELEVLKHLTLTRAYMEPTLAKIEERLSELKGLVNELSEQGDVLSDADLHELRSHLSDVKKHVNERNITEAEASLSSFKRKFSQTLFVGKNNTFAEGILSTLNIKNSKERKMKSKDLLLYSTASNVQGEERILTPQLIKEQFEKSLPAEIQDAVAPILSSDSKKLASNIRKNSTLTVKKDEHGNQALHYAAAVGDVECVRVLCDAKAGLAAQNKYKLQPLHIAAFFGHAEAVTLLVNRGAPLELAPLRVKEFDLQCSPLHLAVLNSQYEVTDYLLSQVDGLAQQIRIAGGLGNILHLAVLARDPWILRELVNHPKVMVPLSSDYSGNYDPYNECNDHGYTPLSLAVHIGNMGAVSILARHTRVCLSTSSRMEGYNVLHFAARDRQKEAIEIVLGAIGQKEGAVNLLNQHDNSEKRRTAYHLARNAKKKARESGDTNVAEEYEVMMNCLNDSILGELKELHQKPNSDHLLIQNLVFQGGGPKGIAYVQALEVLDNMFSRRAMSIHNVKRVGGTSAGAITAFALAIGLSLDEIREAVGNLEISTLLDEVDITKLKGYMEEITAIQRGEKPKTVAGSLLLKVIQDTYGLTNKLQVGKHLLLHRQRVWDDFNKLTGLCSGHNFTQWLQEVLEKKLKREGLFANYGTGLTFRQLAELVATGKYQCKHLHVVAYKVSGQPQLVDMNSEDLEEWGDVSIIDAVRASMSIPGVFKPQEIKRQNKRGEFITEAYVDGGLLMNYPIRLFDKVRYLSRYLTGDKNYEIFNEETLGLRLVDKNGQASTATPPLSSPFDLIKHLIGAFYNAEQLIGEFENKYQYRSIAIDDCGVGTLDFDISDKQRNNLQRAGKDAVLKFYGAYNDLARLSNRSEADAQRLHPIAETSYHPAQFSPRARQHFFSPLSSDSSSSSSSAQSDQGMVHSNPK